MCPSILLGCGIRNFNLSVEIFIMSKKQLPAGAKKLRAWLAEHGHRQAFIAWLGGVHERHGRAWLLGEYPVPLHIDLLTAAISDGLISIDWLESHIKKPKP